MVLCPTSQNGVEVLTFWDVRYEHIRHVTGKVLLCNVGVVDGNNEKALSDAGSSSSMGIVHRPNCGGGTVGEPMVGVFPGADITEGWKWPHLMGKPIRDTSTRHGGRD